MGVALAQILYGRSDIAALDRVPAFNPAGLTAWFGASALGLVLMFAGGSVSSFSAPLTAIVAFGLQAGLSHMNRLGTESLE